MSRKVLVGDHITRQQELKATTHSYKYLKTHNKIKGQNLELLLALARSTGLWDGIYLCADGCELLGVPYERISWDSIHTGAAFHLQGIMLSVTTCPHI